MLAVVAAVAIAVAAPYLAPFVVQAGLAVGVTISTAVATALVGLALSVAATLAFRAIGLGAPKASNQVGPPQIFRQTITDSFIVYGERRVGGLLVFYHPRVDGSDHYRYFVIAVAGHRCKGVVSFMLNDEIVTLDGSNMVTSGKYANGAWLWFVRGTDTDVANATFVSETDGKWTTDHKGLGVAKIYAKFKLTDDVIQAGMPNITAIIEGKDDIRDPRDDSEDYQRNAILVTYDFMAMAREEGGFGAYDDEIPDDTFISAQANVCDETVNGEPRYCIDAVLTTGSAPSEVKDALILNMAGKGAYVGGKHLIRPGYWVPVSQTLSENDLAGPIQVSPIATADAAVTEVQGTYISPTDNYQGMPLSTKSVASDDVRQLSVDLGFVTNKDQGDRILSIILNKAQCEKTLVWTMNIMGLKVQALDTVQVDCARYGLNNYAWCVDGWQLSPDLSIVLNLSEENADIYADITPIAPVAPPAIDVATPILTTAQTIELIRTSSVQNPDPSTPILSASETEIYIKTHNRVYSDKTVSVDGNTGGAILDETGHPILDESGDPILDEAGTSTPITGLTAGTHYYLGYNDPGREGGPVTYVVSTDIVDVLNTGADGALPFMHYVGDITTAAAGSGGTTSGGVATPPGVGGGSTGGGVVYQ